MSQFDTNAPTSANGLSTQTVQTGTRGQTFRNFQVPNTRSCLYQLQIRQPGNDNGLYSSYTFPLSPESVRKEPNFLSNFYDVAGDATNNGVQRVIDIYGMTPATFIIEGTTGWQLHQTDNYQYTGLQSIARIENLLAQWTTLCQQQIQNGSADMYQLWFLDFFRQDFWQVVPIGPQGVRQNASRPLWVSYAFRLVGVRNIASAELQKTDPLSQTLSTPDSQSSQTLQDFANDLVSTYSPSTAVAD